VPKPPASRRPRLIQGVELTFTALRSREMVKGRCALLAAYPQAVQPLVSWSLQVGLR
jgi:hypothetical protein